MITQSFLQTHLIMLLSALFTFSLWWFAGYLIERSLKKIIHYKNNDALTHFLITMVRKGCIGLGSIFALGKLGFDITGILAGLGLTGFALGFAFKDALSNLIAGIFILFYKPFNIGDSVRVETQKSVHEGRVSAIDLRYTTLTSGERTILIPNSFLITEPISISR